MSELTYRTMGVPDAVTDEFRDWFLTAGAGFLQPRASAESMERWRAEAARDGWRLEAAYAPSLREGREVTVGTFATTTQTINVGAGRLIPACFITDVTVRTTHRRRGILSRMMRNALHRARDAGLSLAALTVTEGGIYGRYGFGVATQTTSAEVGTGPRFGLTHPLQPRVDPVTPEESVPLRQLVFETFHARHRGSHARLAFHDAYLSGEWDYDKDGPHPGMRSAVHLDAAGQPDGVLAWEYERDKEQLTVRDLLALDSEAELGLWQYLASIDLVEKASIARLSPTSPLPWAVTDPRCVRITQIRDFTWLRVLDVPGALQARAFETDGRAGFEVLDPLGLASGCWQVEARDRQATVSAAGSARVQIDVRALGSLYFGLVDARILAAAGQVQGPAQEVSALADLFRTSTPPHNTSGF